MKAITYRGNKHVEYESVDDPRILEPTDAILRVELCAVCGSDLHVYHGREQGLDAGTVMGHEFVGEILEVGNGVKRLRPGTRVLSPFTTNCGRCFYCTRGLTSRCPSGALFGWVEGDRGLHGGQAEFVRVPLADSTLLELPEEVSADAGLLLGDVFSTGYYCASQTNVEAAGTYAVVGCGPVGLSAILALGHLGARHVFAFDSVPARLELAQRLGAQPLDYRADDSVAAVLAATEGRGADGVLELVGNHAAHRLAVDLVRPGGTISVVGVHNEAQFAFSPAEAYDKNLSYRVGRCPARHIAERLLPLVAEGRFDLSPLISHRWELSRGVEAYRVFDEKLDNCIKIALVP